VQVADVEREEKLIMPICTRCDNNPLDRVQEIGYTKVSASLARNPTACYADRKPELRMLYGSI